LPVFSDLDGGEVITFTVVGIDSLTCQAFDANRNAIGSPFTIDSSCDGGRPLALQQEFGDGGILTFQKYVCTGGETHSCLLDVEYNIEICNVGPGTEDLSLIQLIITEGPPTFVDTVNFESPTSILEGACVSVPYDSQVDVCTKKDYNVTAVVVADEPNTGIPCDGTDTITFDSSDNTLPPTGTPTVSPTIINPPPTPLISAPTPIPTSDDGGSFQPTPDPRGCPPSEPDCDLIPCTSDCECEALYPGESTGVCICEEEVPDECEFDDGTDDGCVDNGHDGDDDDSGKNTGKDGKTASGKDGKSTSGRDGKTTSGKDGKTTSGRMAREEDVSPLTPARSLVMVTMMTMMMTAMMVVALTVRLTSTPIFVIVIVLKSLVLVSVTATMILCHLAIKMIMVTLAMTMTTVAKTSPRMAKTPARMASATDDDVIAAANFMKVVRRRTVAISDPDVYRVVVVAASARRWNLAMSKKWCHHLPNQKLAGNLGYLDRSGMTWMCLCD
jgi:hypothetical protein